MKVKLKIEDQESLSQEIINCQSRDDLMLALISQATFDNDFSKMLKQPSEYYNFAKKEKSDEEILTFLDEEYGNFLDRRGTSFEDMLKLLTSKSITVFDGIYNHSNVKFSII